MIIAGLLLGAMLAAPTAQGAPSDWSDTLLKDLDAADAAMRGSHPGAVDLRNPGFVPQLEAASALARSRAQRRQLRRLLVGDEGLRGLLQ